MPGTFSRDNDDWPVDLEVPYFHCFEKLGSAASGLQSQAKPRTEKQIPQSQPLNHHLTNIPMSMIVKKNMIALELILHNGSIQ